MPVDAIYQSRRAELLKEIKMMTGKDRSNQFPLLQAKEISDESYLEQCDLQLEKIENIARSVMKELSR